MKIDKSNPDPVLTLQRKRYLFRQAMKDDVKWSARDEDSSAKARYLARRAGDVAEAKKKLKELEPLLDLENASVNTGTSTLTMERRFRKCIEMRLKEYGEYEYRQQMIRYWYHTLK